jgi:hypothetical protein
LSQGSASADFAPPVRACPTCGAECKRHSTYTRRIKDVSLDGPVTLQIPVGRYRCPNCRKFHQPDLPFAGARKRYTDRAVRKATVAVQEDKTTYTALPHRLARDFAIRPAKSTGWAWFQDFAGRIDVGEYLRWACGRFSGQLSVDSVQDGEMQMWFATDPLNRDLILGYHRAERADGESLAAFLTALRDDFGIVPALIVTDDAQVFLNTPQRVWPEAHLQLCHFHAIKRLNYHSLRHSLRERFKRCQPTKGADRQARQEWADAHRKRRLFFKRPDAAGEDEQMAGWCERWPALRVFRTFIRDFYSLMSCRDAAEAELLRRLFVARWTPAASQDGHLARVVDYFRDGRWFARLFAFADFENASRTTNSTERANRWFRKRQKTHYRNRTEPTIRNMLHADLIYRRERTDPAEPPVRLRPKLAPLAESA